MNILITGANGQLGSEFRAIAAKASAHYIFADITDHPTDATLRLDITDLEAVRAAVREHHVEMIVNCAAYTNVDAAETDADTADRLNHVAPQLLAQAMHEVGGWLIHISTDYVFGGTPHCTPIAETATPAPTGVYGLTKLRGEEAIQASGCHHLIFRTAWLYSPYGRNFVKTMAQLTADRDTLNVVVDQTGTPTHAADLAAAIAQIIEAGSYVGHEGVYHFSNEGVCSWYDFAIRIAELAGNTCHIHPCRSDQFPSPVRRPSYSVLDKSKVKQTFGIDIPHWTTSLERMFTSAAQ
ncbi:MAG: dTDP-4-dehydrorhamnose reductase [Bacteroidaceae bacterium]|nr:dTDP-4-dehydrorhamnose reductase [Bacteroidaceae bacterium]